MATPGPDERKSDRDILRQIRLAPGPVATATEIAENLEYSRQNVNHRLNDLEEEGFVKSKQVGARARIWWLTDEGEVWLLTEG